MTTRYHITQADIDRRASATYTRADIVERRPHYVTFWAVYTTPDGEVADRVYCYSDMVCADRRPPGFRTSKERLADAQMGRVVEWLARRAGRQTQL